MPRKPAATTTPPAAGHNSIGPVNRDQLRDMEPSADLGAIAKPIVRQFVLFG
jgi:hypothetical protein